MGERAHELESARARSTRKRGVGGTTEIRRISVEIHAIDAAEAWADRPLQWLESSALREARRARRRALNAGRMRRGSVRVLDREPMKKLVVVVKATECELLAGHESAGL